MNYTNEIHWFIFAALGYLLYKEIYIERPFAWYDFIIVAPFFGGIIGVVAYRWLDEKVRNNNF